MKIFDHRGDKFWTATRGIKIVVAQQQRSACSLRALAGCPKGLGVSEMEQPGGRRREPTAVSCMGDSHWWILMNSNRAEISWKI
jgi:hypothetical protein